MGVEIPNSGAMATQGVPSPDKVERIKKGQSHTARKHSSVKRNPPQTEKHSQLQQNIQHQQWMNQTLPTNMMAVSKVEGGGSGGSGGSQFGSQDQIN